MARHRKRGRRAARPHPAAAIQAAGLGLFLILLPHLLGHSLFALMFRPFATFGWLLLVGGGAVIAAKHLHKSRLGALPAFPTAQPLPPFQPSSGASRRPFQAPPNVERVEPVVPVEEAPSWRFRIVDTVRPPVVAEPAVEPVGRQHPTSWGPDVFAVIEWRRFEAVVEALFGQAGFQTKSQSHGPDEGIDVWLYSKNQANGEPVSLVQCKHWQGKRVGVDKVRELRGVMADKGVTRGQFATTSTFTSEATSFAEKNGIKLHDGAGLLEVIRSRTPQQQQGLLDVALEGDYWRPTCVNCGVKLVERSSKEGKSFWGCASYPKCRMTMQKARAG